MVNPMDPYVLVVAISTGVWYLVKQIAVTFQSPRVWDHAEPAAALVGAGFFAYVHRPSAFVQTDPVGVRFLHTLEFGVGVFVLALMLGVAAEEEGLLRTPDKLAPPKARLLEQVSSVDELGDDVLAEYTEGRRA